MKNIISNKIKFIFKIHIIIIITIFFISCSNNDLINNETNNEVNINIDNENKNTNTNKNKESKIIIVAFGDSLTEGLYVERENAYPAQLERSLLEKEYSVKVYNSGLSGETSTGALSRIDWVLRLNPDIVILGIGANDAIRGIDLNLTQKNILTIVQKLKKENITVILSGQEIYDNLGEEYVKQFKEIYPKIAKDENINLIPLFLDGVAGNSSLNNIDEIHPNKEGYKIIVEKNILPVLEKELKLIKK
ncbi:MAG: arylesterase [Nanoarchaeota archaeon]|nr:arylesterase [Nanoarchaeota archaeon]